MPGLARLKVLVVDDEPDARELVRLVFQARHVEVRAVASGAEGLAMLDAFLPDVILCDISMPQMDGFAFIQAVRRRPPERGGRIPAAALTACARAEDRTRALRSGFQLHLAKPVEPMELVAAVVALASTRPAP